MTNACRASTAGKINLSVLLSVQILIVVLPLQYSQSQIRGTQNEIPPERKSQPGCPNTKGILGRISPFERLLLVSRQVILFFASQEAAHKTQLGSDGFFGVGICLYTGILSTIHSIDQ